MVNSVEKIEKLFLMYDLFYYDDKSWNPTNEIGGEKNTPKENSYKHSKWYISASHWTCWTIGKKDQPTVNNYPLLPLKWWTTAACYFCANAKERVIMWSTILPNNCFQIFKNIERNT